MNIGTPTFDIKILSLSSGLWGAEESLLIIGAELARRQLTVGLVCVSPDLRNRWLSSINEDAQLSTGFRGRVGAVSQILGAWRSALRRSPERRARRTVYILFSHRLALALPVVIAVRWIMRGVVVVDLHDNLSPNRVASRLLRFVLNSVDGVVAVSEHVRAQLDRGLSTCVLHRPVRIQRDRSEAEHWSPQTPLRVAIIGRIDHEKNHRMVIDAVGRVEGTALLVRGAAALGGEQYAQGVLEFGAAALGERFLFEGQVPTEEVMKEVDVLVVGNSREPLGRTVREAHAAGVLVVVPNSGGSFELVAGGRNGLVYVADSAESLAEILSAVATDPVAFRDIVQSGYREVVRSGTPSVYVDRLISVLELWQNGV